MEKIITALAMYYFLNKHYISVMNVINIAAGLPETLFPKSICWNTQHTDYNRFDGNNLFRMSIC